MSICTLFVIQIVAQFVFSQFRSVSASPSMPLVGRPLVPMQHQAHQNSWVLWCVKCPGSSPLSVLGASLHQSPLHVRNLHYQTLRSRCQHLGRLHECQRFFFNVLPHITPTHVRGHVCCLTATVTRALTILFGSNQHGPCQSFGQRQPAGHRAHF